MNKRVRSSVPIARTEIWEEDPHTARLRWHRAYIPRYYSSTPIKYRVEMQEEVGGIGDTDWRPVASNVTRSDYTIRNISPKKDYRFRIRAEMENGEVSDPTPPIQYYKSHLPVNREPLADFKLVEYETVFINRPYFDHLTKYVPPRMPIVKPDMVVIDQESVELMWKPAIVAESIKGICNLSYTIEVRCPPSFEWRELVSGVRICSHTITQLHPRIDYIFRVRAWNEYGCSETTLPVSLYRPQAARLEDDDDEEFEREWELKYGTQVPPKLPIDTPKIVTQSSDSIWFSWLPARIPAYATQTNINYVVEVKEPPSSAWKREATGLLDCQHVLEGLNPNQEYYIRVRAETEFGPSEPTMPIIIRGKGSRSSSRRSSVDRDEPNLDGKLDVTYLENLMSGVPPRMPSTRPIATNAEPDRLTLKWSSCRTPSYVRASNVTYVIEKREPPGHVWSVVAKDIKSTKYDVTGLNGDQDYMFRVRAKNEFGVSEPTLPMTIYRDRDDYVPHRVRSRSSSRDSLFGSRGRGRSSSIDYTSSRFEDIDRSSVDRIPCEPEYDSTTYDTQYGIVGNKGKIKLKVKSYPLPTVHWYFNDNKLEFGDQYNAFVTPQGDVVLEIKKVGLDTAGQYKCYAENTSGSANKVVTFELAEPPTVLEPLQDYSVTEHEPVKFTCRVDGFPNATVKWTKDWRPVAGSTHCKISHPAGETYTLEIPNTVETDAALYACTIENVAGKVVLTGRLTVEIDTLPATFDDVNIRSTPIEERYHILEEIGRGRFGVVRRVIEMSTGRTFAANYMSFRNKSQKNFFMSEFETLRMLSQTDGILKLFDAFETDRSLIFVTEFLSEPELLEKIVADGNWTETNVAVTMKKLLTLLAELEKLRVLHLDIKPGNIRMSGDDLKLMGLGYSRMLLQDEDITHNYGSVGYASPEQITNDVVTNASDLWSVGVLAYLLLSGNGPFQGSSEVEILSLMSECLWTFEGRGFDNFSKDAKDFIGRLLIRDPKKRMSLSECLSHPWLSTQSDAKINTEKLKQFYNAEKLQTEVEKVFTTVQLQSFAKIIHGRKALYQPAVDIESGEIIFPDSDEFGNYLDEDAWYQWQLQYLDDPDSQIYPIQDEGFTVRECRHAGAPKFSKPKIKDRSDRDDIDSGTGILFRDKIQPTTFRPGDDVTFSCTVITEKKNVTPVITWYRDEQLLTDDYRSEAEFNPETGVAKLTIVNTKDYDSSVYKCVARTKEGRVSCQARLYLGDIPSKPGRPLVMQTSGKEAFLTWNCPVSDGNAYILGYRVDYRIGKYTTWTIGPYVTEEYALINDLTPNTAYLFRVSCHNKYGSSPFSWSSLETKTLGADAPKVSVAKDLLPVMQFSTYNKHQLILPAESRRPSLSVVDEAKLSESDPNETFTFSDTISKGSYGEYKSCINKTTNQQCVAKIMPYNKDNHDFVTAEFELLHTLRQANLITVLDSYIYNDKLYVVHEYLSGMNILEYLCLHKTYSEEKVATLVRQILDAVQFLQYYGIVHLNLQPSSVAMASSRRPHIKLRDFTLAHKLDVNIGMTGAPAGYPDFTCPEVLKEEKVSYTADIWTVGALTFTMLSGISPFGGKNLEETLSRILFDRYTTKEMYDNVTKESVKFVCKLMARLPRNRPTVAKCLSSQWLDLNENMVKSRSSRHFKSEKLRSFLTYYMGKRGNEDYKVAKVDIETLPKIVPAPKSDPILSEKILNKMDKKVAPVVSLSEVLHEEAAKIAELPLLEKLVYKIERDTEVEQEDMVTTAEMETKVEEESLEAKIDKDVETVVEEKIAEEEVSRSEAEVKSEIISATKETVEPVKTDESEVIVDVQKEVAEKPEIVSSKEVEELDKPVKKGKMEIVEELNVQEIHKTEQIVVETEAAMKPSKIEELKEDKPAATKPVDVEKKQADATTELKETDITEKVIEKKEDAAVKKVEEKTEAQETEEVFVDALESIAPDGKPAEEQAKAETKDDDDDEFTEAMETNGEEGPPSSKVQSSESIQSIESLAESKAEEITSAALEEIAVGKPKSESSPTAEDKIDAGLPSEKADQTASGAESVQTVSSDSDKTNVVKSDVDSEKKADVIESKSNVKPKTKDLSDEKEVIGTESISDSSETTSVSKTASSDVTDKPSEISSKDDTSVKKESETTEEMSSEISTSEDKSRVSTETLETSKESINREISETAEKIAEKAVEEVTSAVVSSDVQTTEVDKTEVKSKQMKTDEIDTSSVPVEEKEDSQVEVTEAKQVEKTPKQVKEEQSEAQIEETVASDSSEVCTDSKKVEENVLQTNASSESSSTIESIEKSDAKSESKDATDSSELDKLNLSTTGEENFDATIAGQEKSTTSESVTTNESAVSEGILMSKTDDSESAHTNETAAAESSTSDISESISKDDATKSESMLTTETEVSESLKRSQASESKSLAKDEATVEMSSSAVSESVTKSETTILETAAVPETDVSESGSSVSKSETKASESSSTTETSVSESVSKSETTVPETTATSETAEEGSSETKIETTASEGSSTTESSVSEGSSQSKTTVSETTSTSETAVSESGSKDDTAPSESSSRSKTTVSETISTSETAVSESGSKDDTAPSESSSRSKTTVSETISTSETAVSESGSKDDTAPFESSSRSKTTVSETISTSETAVSESGSKDDAAPSESSSKSKTIVSETISTSETAVSESGSKDDAAPSESSSKSKTTVSDTVSASETVVSESGSKDDAAASESSSKSKTTVSDTVSTSETVVSESGSKDDTAASESSSKSKTSDSVLTSETTVSESGAKDDIIASASSSKSETTVSDSLSTSETVVSESGSKDGASASESSSKSKTSDSVSTSETTVSESGAKDDIIASASSSKSETTVSDSLSTSETVVSESGSKDDTKASESSSKSETTITESSSTSASESGSKDEASISKAADFEKVSKTESTLSEVSESVTTSESTVETDALESITKKETVSESVSTSESAISETNAKDEAAVSKSSITNESDISKNQSENITQSASDSKQVTESVVSNEQDKLSESNELTKDKFDIKKSEINDLDVTDSSESISSMEVSKQESAKQEIVENISDSKLISKSAESSMAENVVVTQDTSSEDLVSSAKKSMSVVESVEEKIEGGKLEVTEKKETNVVVNENLVSGDETAVVKSSSVSKETSATVVDEQDGTKMESAVTEKMESSAKEVQSSQEMSGSVTVSKEEFSQSTSSTICKDSETTTVTSVERKETLISGSMLTGSSEETMNISSSMVEESFSEMDVASNLELAKVTKARETVREFMSNDSEIEEMKKEILEDMEVTSEDCGKYLLGSHEDLASLKDKSFSKPDEEKIAKETSMNYLDDALMFC